MRYGDLETWHILRFLHLSKHFSEHSSPVSAPPVTFLVRKTKVSFQYTCSQNKLQVRLLFHLYLLS